MAGAPGRHGSGEVVVIKGRKRSAAGETTFIRPPAGAAGDRFGAAIAMSGHGGFESTDLWIGAPGRDVGGRRDAGAVYRYALDGVGGARLLGVLTQGTQAVGDRAEAGDRFGERLAPVWSGVVAGVPREDVGSRRDAGALEYLRVASAGGMLRGQHFDQGSGGRERPERGDRFGAAVFGHQDGAWAGAPGEDLPGAVDAGVIQDFDRPGGQSTARRLRAGRVRSQGSGPGVPGVAEAGDRFGSAIATGASLACAEDAGVAVGAPGEDIGGARDAGAVTMTQIGDEVGCAAAEMWRGHGLRGPPHADDRVGATLGITPDRPGLDEDTYDTLLIGAPGSGVVLTTNAGHTPTRGTLPAPPGAHGFGRVFALPSDD